MFNKQIFLIFSLVLLSSKAQSATLCGSLSQGEILIGSAPNATAVYFNQKPLPLNSNGNFLLALGRDEPSKGTLSIEYSDNTQNHNLEISPTKWDIQDIKGIPPRKVTPSDSDLREIEFEQKLVRSAQQTTSNNNFWQQGFIMPLQGRISGKFGGQRIMNGVKKNPHAGTDIAAPAGTPIKSPAEGIITLAQPNLFYSGNVVIIDHGLGLHTIYAHLQTINVKQGDTVKQGDIIGLVGKTGRATGPHLHWGASANGTKFNPSSLLNINTANDFCFNL